MQNNLVLQFIYKYEIIIFLNKNFSKLLDNNEEKETYEEIESQLSYFDSLLPSETNIILKTTTKSQKKVLKINITLL